MANNILWVVVIVVIIIAVIFSITIVIKVNNLYTKDEIDVKFSEIGPAVLRQFNNQIIINSDGNYNGVPQSCADICGTKYTCVNGLVKFMREIKTSIYNDRFSQEALVSCNEKLALGTIIDDAQEWKEYSLSCACR
ncbi:MAG: hypothetical protein WC584_02490 [Candidatus Pacearchaeota archaeon]